MSTLTLSRGHGNNFGVLLSQEQVTLAQLAYLLRQAQAYPPGCTFEQLQQAPKAERDLLKKTAWYVAASFKGARRLGAELVSCSAVVLDADKPGATREALIAALNALGCAYLIVTSTSHGIDGQARYRVIVPLAQPVSPERYAVVWAALAARLPGIDPGAKDATRLNYLPKVPTGAAGHEVTYTDGRPWLDASTIEAPAQAPVAAPTTPATVEITEEQAADLRSALMHPALLEAAADRSVWVEVGIALLSLGSTGFELWADYCKSAANYKPGDELSWWQSNEAQTPRSDYRHIFTLASARGWSNPGAHKSEPAAPGEFSAISEFAPPPADSAGELEGAHGAADADTPTRRLSKAVHMFRLMTNKEGKPISNTENANRALKVLLRGALRFDEFTQTVLIEWPEPPRKMRPWIDNDAVRMQMWLQTYGMTSMSVKSVADAAEAIAREHPCNIIVEWLLGLQWDGTRRLSTWLARAFGTPSDRYHMRVGRNLLIAMVARAMAPGCKVDEAMVLEGEQGIKKTQALEIIGDCYFRELTARVDSKDFEQQLRGVWLGEFSELATIKRPEDIERVKQFLTCRCDHYRPSYGRIEQDFPRRIVFCGSTNAGQWIHDRTGGRRFNPVRVERVDLEWLRANREQLFAEAVRLYKMERTWWTFPTKAARAHQAERVVEDPWESPIVAYLKGRNTVTTGDILNWALNVPAKDQNHSLATRVGQALKRLGCEQRRTNSAKHWVVAPEFANQKMVCSGPTFSQPSHDDAADLLGGTIQ